MRNPFVPMNIFAGVDVSGACHLSGWQCNIQALSHSFFDTFLMGFPK
jgi:hypothetical protein